MTEQMPDQMRTLVEELRLHGSEAEQERVRIVAGDAATAIEQLFGERTGFLAALIAARAERAAYEREVSTMLAQERAARDKESATRLEAERDRDAARAELDATIRDLESLRLSADEHRKSQAQAWELLVEERRRADALDRQLAPLVAAVRDWVDYGDSKLPQLGAAWQTWKENA